MRLRIEIAFDESTKDRESDAAAILAKLASDLIIVGAAMFDNGTRRVPLKDSEGTTIGEAWLFN